MPPKPKQGPRKLTAQDREEIIRRCRAGEPRNAIARAVNRSGATVSKIATEAGLTFERGPEVIAATIAQATDLAARRIAMATRLHDEAERELDLLRAPTLYWDWGGKDHDYDDKLVDQPIPSDRRAIMLTVNTALDQSRKLSPPVDENGAEAVGSLLGGLFDRLRADHGDG
jgi:hypothetical protein